MCVRWGMGIEKAFIANELDFPFAAYENVKG